MTRSSIKKKPRKSFKKLSISQTAANTNESTLKVQESRQEINSQLNWSKDGDSTKQINNNRKEVSKSKRKSSFHNQNIIYPDTPSKNKFNQTKIETKTDDKKNPSQIAFTSFTENLSQEHNGIAGLIRKYRNPDESFISKEKVDDSGSSSLKQSSLIEEPLNYNGKVGKYESDTVYKSETKDPQWRLTEQNNRKQNHLTYVFETPNQKDTSSKTDDDWEDINEPEPIEKQEGYRIMKEFLETGNTDLLLKVNRKIMEMFDLNNDQKWKLENQLEYQKLKADTYKKKYEVGF